MTATLQSRWDAQQDRNRQLLAQSPYLGREMVSEVLPVHFDIDATPALAREQVLALEALGIEAARIALQAVGELGKIKEVDHLGGALDMIPALALTLALVDYEKREFTIENAHTSIGYYGLLAALGFLDPKVVTQKFRQSLSIAGHVAWLPGGTQLNAGRLGVMVPAAAGQALGLKARHGLAAWVLCHCGDAGWVAGTSLNGYNVADVHKAPLSFIMHRNGIQLSGSTQKIMPKDPRPAIAALGVEILETPSLHDLPGLYAAYRAARALARDGRPSLIFPAGYRSTAEHVVDLTEFGRKYGILDAVTAFAGRQKVAMDTQVWIPGALMSFRDLNPMIECLFFVNNLPGGKYHHDGHMKDRDCGQALQSPLLQPSAEQTAALSALRARPRRKVVTRARPAPGTPNLVLPPAAIAAVKLPAAGENVSARAGSGAGYGAVARQFPDHVFMVDCDLAPSTKIDSARAALKPDHQFELSIEEQAAAIMANGLAVSTRDPQLVVFATFAAFFEGIAREGFEMWRYQRNLTGANEGLNVTYHLSHVGANTGRDHFSGWSLDWINIALTYMPYLDRFYAPADARAAFLAVRDLAARYGAHIIGIPRDNLPVLAKADGAALWNPGDAWEPVTMARQFPGARKVVLAMGAPAYLAIQVAEKLAGQGTAADVYIVNGLPLAAGWLAGLAAKYPAGVVTIEDGLIGDPASGWRGLAGLVAGVAGDQKWPHDHVGIVDPRIAPSDGFAEVWAHFGITADAVAAALKSL